MKPTVAFSVALAAVTGAGCSYQVVSPPARMVSLESARTARPGETVAGVKGGMYAAVFDPGVAVGSAGVRHGVEDNVELNVEGTWARVVYDGYPEIDRNIYAGRVGFKSSNARGSAAVLGGVGGGFAPAAGSFVAADFGGVLSRPSCLAVPFIGASVFASLPFDTKQVDFRRDDGTIHASDTADTTYGLSLGAGLEIPLDRERCRQGRTPTRLLLGLSTASLYPSDGPITTTTTTTGEGTTTTSSTRGGRYGAVGLAAGIEFPF